MNAAKLFIEDIAFTAYREGIEFNEIGVLAVIHHGEASFQNFNSAVVTAMIMNCRAAVAPPDHQYCYRIILENGNLKTGFATDFSLGQMKNGIKIPVTESEEQVTDFFEFNSLAVGGEGDIFTEELGGIHSIINNENDISVSLHLYKREELNLEGVRIFDTEHRKIAYLSKEAQSCSWDLPENAYTKIIQI